MDNFAYFIGCLILGAFWILFFNLRKDLRKQMFFGGLLGVPFGLTEFLYVPEYWNPPSLFNLIDKFGVGIESLLFGFFVGGICSVVFEIIDRKKLIKIKSDHKTHLLPYILVFLIYISLELVFPAKSIYNLSYSLLIGAAVILLSRRDLFQPLIASALIFSLLYFSLFKLFELIFPGFISSFYNLPAFWGIMLWGIPIEEILFAFSVGACWSTLYDYILGYRLRKL